MDIATMLPIIRQQTGTDPVNMPTATLMPYVNMGFHDLEWRIVALINEHYFYGQSTIDTVANQSKYSLPLGWSGANVAWSRTPNTELRKLISVWVKYSSSAGKYTKATQSDQSTAEEFIDTYETLQDQWSPVFLIQDKALWIYPAPTAIVTAGIKIEAIKKLVDLTSTTVEANIWIPWEYHDMIILATRPWVFRHRWLANKAIEAQNEYEAARSMMLSKFTNFNTAPVERGIYTPIHLMK